MCFYYVLEENSEDVLELLEVVPELDSAFTVMNKIGSGVYETWC